MPVPASLRSCVFGGRDGDRRRRAVELPCRGCRGPRCPGWTAGGPLEAGESTEASDWVRLVRLRILRPNQAMGSYEASTTRSLRGMMALSVILMCSGQTSVQHLVILHFPRPCSCRRSSRRSLTSSGCISNFGGTGEEAGPAKAVLFSSWSRMTWHTSWHRYTRCTGGLLAPLHVDLLHPDLPAFTSSSVFARGERRYPLGHLVVVGDVGDQVPEDGEGPHGRDGDRLAGRQGVHPGHAHQGRAPVDLRRTGAAFSRLAVPPAGQVRA